MLHAVLTVFLWVSALYSIYVLYSWGKILSLIIRYGWLHASHLLIAQGNKNGIILLIMGLGDKWFKIMMGIPIIGILITLVWFLWIFIKGTITIKAVVVVIILQCLFGWILIFLIRIGTLIILTKGKVK